MHRSWKKGLKAVPNPKQADVAQLVERNLAKVEVAGSNLVICSRKAFEFRRLFFVNPTSQSVDTIGQEGTFMHRISFQE